MAFRRHCQGSILVGEPLWYRRVSASRLAQPNGRAIMRMFFGMVLGALLTVTTAYVVDHWRPDTSTAAEPRAMVNWSVVEDNLRTVRMQAQEVWSKLSQKMSS